MANSILGLISLQVTNGSFADQVSENINTTQTTIGQVAGTISVPTGGTTLSFSSLSSPGYFFFQNLDTVQSITLSVGTAGVPFSTTAAGLVGMFPLANVGSVKLQSNGGTPQLQYKIFSA